MDYKSLVIEAKQNPQQGFTLLYNSTYKEMKYLALKLVKNETDADDVLQEAYIKAWKNLYSLQQPERFQSWMSSIVVNTAKNHLKKKNPYLFSQLQSEEDDGTAFEYQIADESIENHPELAYSRKETAKMVNILLDSLDDEQRICVLMRYQGDTKIKDIAEQLGISENTVKSRLRYANKNMNAKAEEMKKKGYRFYGIAPLPLLILLLRREMNMYAAGGVVATAAAAGAKAATSRAKTGFLSTLAGKITAAVTAVAVAGAAIGAGVAVSHSHNKTEQVESSKTSVTTVAQQEETPQEKPKEKVNSDKVVLSYLDYLKDDYPYDSYDFSFIFIDDDDIPELYVDGEIAALPRFILSYNDGKVEEINSGVLSYKEKSGVYQITPYHFQIQESYSVFSLKDGKSESVGYGVCKYNGAEDESGYTYTWDDKSVSAEEFEKLHTEAFDESSATPIHTEATFPQAVEALEKKLGISIETKTKQIIEVSGYKAFIDAFNNRRKEEVKNLDPPLNERGFIDEFSFYDVDRDGIPELFARISIPDGEGDDVRICRVEGDYETMWASDFIIPKADYCLIQKGDVWESFYYFNPTNMHKGFCERFDDSMAKWDDKDCSMDTYFKKRDKLADVNDTVKLKYYSSIEKAFKAWKK